MSRLPLVVALVLSISLVVLAQPPFPCTYTNANEVKYDLTNMWRNPGQGQADFQFSGTADGSVYWVNVCGQAAEVACNPPNGVCQIAMDGSGYGDGDASTAKWQNLDNNANGVKITVTNGSGGPCNGVPRTSYLQIACDDTAGDGTIDSVTESQSVKCQYTIAMRSKWACGQTSGGPPPPPPPPGGPPPPGPPSKPKGGLSIGSIILITVACIIPVYLVVGALIKWKVYEAEPLSVDIIPNVGFWSALPFLVKDGCVYFVQKVSGGRVCGEYGQI